MAAELGELYAQAPTEEVAAGEQPVNQFREYGISMEILGRMGVNCGLATFSGCSDCSGCGWTMIHISKIC